MSNTDCTRRHVLLAGLGTLLLGSAARSQRDPAILQEMRNLYGLTPEQDVKVIPKPFRPVRQLWSGRSSRSRPSRSPRARIFFTSASRERRSAMRG